MDCPNCGLAKPKDALECDCSYNFETDQIVKPVVQSNIKEETDT